MTLALDRTEFRNWVRTAKGAFGIKNAADALTVAYNNELRGLLSGRHSDASFVNKLEAYQQIAVLLTAQYSRFESLDEYESAFADAVAALKTDADKQARLDAAGLGDFTANEEPF